MSELTQIFNEIDWGSAESKSGSGSELKNTIVLRNELPHLFKKYGITSMLDIPCGDFNWMKEVNLDGIKYHGADIVEEIIISNCKKYPTINFNMLDIVNDELPQVDLVFVRDLFGHLSDDNIFMALDNIVKSKSKYLLATSFTKWDFNPNISNGGWKCINLMIKPYYLKPIYLINENCIEGFPYYNDKCMLLFDLENLRSF